MRLPTICFLALWILGLFVENSFAADAVPKAIKMNDKIIEEIHTLIDAYPGKVGLYVHDLKSDQSITMLADEPFFMASTYKIPILIQLYRDHDAGLLSLDDKITLTPEMQHDGYGLLKSFTPGTTLTLRDIALLMITISDNNATDLILEKVTTDRIQQTFEQFGIHGMRVDRSTKALYADLLRDKHAFYLDKRDSTTPRAMGQFLSKLIKCELTSQSSCEQIKSVLNQQMLNSRLPRRLTPLSHMKIAHKTGSTNRLISDVGFIQIPNRPEIIIVLYAYQENEALPLYVTEDMIGEITQKVVAWAQ